MNDAPAMGAWVNAAPAWVQAVGSVIAIFVAVLVPVLMARAESRRQRKIAGMKLAVRMRRWVRKAQYVVFDVDGYDERLPYMPKCKLPAIPFSTSLENIVHLDQKLARELLRLVDVRESIHSRVESDNLFSSPGEDTAAFFGFAGESASLVLAAMAVVEKISNKARWPLESMKDEDRDRLKKIIQAYEDKRAQHLAEMEQLFSKKPSAPIAAG